MKAFPILLAALAPLSPALAENDACELGRPLISAEAALPRAAAAVAERHSLNVIVLGSGSSTLPAPTGERAAYPARLEAALGKFLPGVDAKVVTKIKARQTAAEMMEQELQRIEEQKPALVIWQTGTVDAIKGVDPEEFRDTLDQGVAMLQGDGVDVVLMNMQYSPRTDAMISITAYTDNMRWVALQHDVPLFDRLALMKHWSELGTFDLYDASKNTDTAERVHDCIGKLLAGLIAGAVKQPAPAAETR
ncbi:MAG: SGNH/GDSL hydrolase family protein [Hyphomicrobiales bacterium]|nr:SGNH/GDSL hydrolase family protein [Hyphomicrobiales bacterium]MBV9429076.1 SGNH/GDSL hydrolase family protein [Bradyrhizobiaceae bacterium]